MSRHREWWTQPQGADRLRAAGLPTRLRAEAFERLAAKYDAPTAHPRTAAAIEAAPDAPPDAPPDADEGFGREAHRVWELRPAETDEGYVLVRKEEERALDFRVGQRVQAVYGGALVEARVRRTAAGLADLLMPSGETAALPLELVFVIDAPTADDDAPTADDDAPTADDDADDDSDDAAACTCGCARCQARDGFDPKARRGRRAAGRRAALKVADVRQGDLEALTGAVAGRVTALVTPAVRQAMAAFVQNLGRVATTWTIEARPEVASEVERAASRDLAIKAFWDLEDGRLGLEDALDLPPRVVQSLRRAIHQDADLRAAKAALVQAVRGGR